LRPYPAPSGDHIQRPSRLVWRRVTNFATLLLALCSGVTIDFSTGRR